MLLTIGLIRRISNSVNLKIMKAEHKEAIVWYDKALDIDSNDAVALHNRSFSLEKL
ncbi:MAG: hypothetical protein HRO68_04510 [Nitrosopumilus sp.]|nr:hypothetical protein [Nitrosopumilus sp.]